MRSAKIPWTRDAVVIVASLAGKEIRSQMDQVLHGACFHCHRAVAYDSFTLDRITQPELARGRPVKLLCAECFPEYDFGQVTHFEDHRGHKA